MKNPETSIQLGTYYLSQQLAARNGSVEDTLAGYNAGPSRVPKWRGWEDYREPSEFVETIPFQQTRDYVQIIQRNADIYRWLYANEPVAVEPEPQVAPARAGGKEASNRPQGAPAKKSAPKTKKKK